MGAVSQYGSLFIIFFTILFLIPAVLMNIFQRRIKYYGMVLSIPMLILLQGTAEVSIILFLIFIVCEMILIFGYYFISRKTSSRFIYFCTLALSMLPILVVKGCIYTSYNSLGFVGISYISFRIWQLIIEIHDKQIKQILFFDVLYFITFFPTLSAGPIDRYQRFKQDLDTIPSRKEYLSDYLWTGLEKIMRGIIYKFGVASFINKCIIMVLPDEHTFATVLIYMYAYTIYLFFDFAGYSSLAIGSSYILGIKVGENFNQPFLAHNMKEFWERWHISLSTWFGDYIYKRFVLNNLRNGLFKNKRTAARCGNIVTMLIMGIWHGPHLFYVVYGLYEGIALVITDIYLKSKVHKKFKKKIYYDLVSRVVCFQVISFGMLIFSGYLFSI